MRERNNFPTSIEDIGKFDSVTELENFIKENYSQISSAELKLQMLKEIRNDIYKIREEKNRKKQKEEETKINELIKILKMKQLALKENLTNILSSRGMPTKSNKGYIYAEGKVPILLVAHLDTYCDTVPTDLTYSQLNYRLYSREDEAIGADDRCGIYVIMEILKELETYVLFTNGEEIGGLGAVAASRQIPAPNVKYIIELDRQGENDCVFYRCGNQEFRSYIKNFGYDVCKGTTSDISTLGAAWNIATVNLSTGYYNAHTTSEYINFNDVQYTIQRIKDIIKDWERVPYFDYQNTFEERRLSKYIDYSDEDLEIELHHYEMLAETGELGKKAKQKIKNK